LSLTLNQISLVQIRRLMYSHVLEIDIAEKLEYFIERLSRGVKPVNSVERAIKILEIVEQVRRQC